jgi:hypothetical protein
VKQLEEKAYKASQDNAFDVARQYLFRAVEKLNPGLVDLVCPTAYEPIQAEPLPNLFENDEALRKGGKQRRMTVSKLKGGYRPAPVLNGELDNSYLEEGVTLDNFRQLNTYEPTKVKTTAYLAWDKQNLYVLFVCNEPMMNKLKADASLERDGPAYEMDCVELFITRNKDSQAYVQFVVSAGGTRYDGRTVEVKEAGKSKYISEVKQWNPDWSFVVKKGKGDWSAEMIIPMSVLGGPPKPGEVWGVNFARERQTKKELSTWSPMEGNFHVTSRYGKITFAR